MRTISRLLCAAALAAVVLPGVATAADPRPDLPAIDQYIEQIPTPAGPKAGAGGDARVEPLPEQVQQRVHAQGGSDADALTELSTSSRYGAPVARDEPREGSGEQPAGDGAGEQPETPAAEELGDDQTVLEAAPSAAADEGDSRVLLLLGFMAASLVGAVAYAVARRR